MKKGDKILIVLVLALALAAFGWIQLTSKEGSRAVVRIDGQEIATYSLSEGQEILLEGVSGGTNLLVIRDGTAAIHEADCPDLLCVKQGAVSRAGETIVCLPHRIVIEIVDGQEAEVDQVVR